jgi:ATP-dependent Lon protease
MRQMRLNMVIFVMGLCASGGVHDEAEIRGHPYRRATGNIIQGVGKAGVRISS